MSVVEGRGMKRGGCMCTLDLADVVIVLCSAHVQCMYYALHAHDTDVVSHCEFS